MFLVYTAMLVSKGWRIPGLHVSCFTEASSLHTLGCMVSSGWGTPGGCQRFYTEVQGTHLLVQEQ